MNSIQKERKFSPSKQYKGTNREKNYPETFHLPFDFDQRL